MSVKQYVLRRLNQGERDLIGRLATGQLLTGSLLDYAAPHADSLPNIRSQFQETPSPTNPLGVKGIGESGSIGAPPTIVHAVLDALAPFGIGHLDMPLTPQKIWAAIREAHSGDNRRPRESGGPGSALQEIAATGFPLSRE